MLNCLLLYVYYPYGWEYVDHFTSVSFYVYQMLTITLGCSLSHGPFHSGPLSCLTHYTSHPLALPVRKAQTAEASTPLLQYTPLPSRSSNTLATWCKEPAHWKRPWCWERLRARGEGAGRGWGGYIAPPTQWTWIWTNSRRQWRTGRPGVLQSMGSQSQTWLNDWTIASVCTSHYWLFELRIFTRF